MRLLSSVHQASPIVFRHPGPLALLVAIKIDSWLLLPILRLGYLLYLSFISPSLPFPSLFSRPAATASDRYGLAVSSSGCRTDYRCVSRGGIGEVRPTLLLPVGRDGTGRGGTGTASWFYTSASRYLSSIECYFKYLRECERFQKEAYYYYFYL